MNDAVLRNMTNGEFLAHVERQVDLTKIEYELLRRFVHQPLAVAQYKARVPTEYAEVVGREE